MKLSQLFEGVGSDVLELNDYVNSTGASEQIKADMRKLIALLIKNGFTLERNKGKLRLVKDIGQEGDYIDQLIQFDIPKGHDGRTGIITAHIARTLSKDNTYRFQNARLVYSASEILEMGFDSFIEHLKSRKGKLA